MQKKKIESVENPTLREFDTVEEGAFIGFNRMGLSRDNLPIAKSSMPCFAHLTE